MRRLMIMLLAVTTASQIPGLAAGTQDDCAGQTMTGCVRDVDGDMTVDGELILRDGALLRFTNTTGSHDLAVAGSLDVRNATIQAAEDVDLTIRFSSGSTGTLHDATLDGYRDLEVDDASLGVENATLTALGTALRIGEGVGMVLRNSTLTAPVALDVGENATVALEGTATDGAVELHPAARLDLSWFVDVQADLGALELGGSRATLRIQNAGGAEIHGVEVADGDEASFLLATQTRRGQESETFGPHRFILTFKENATYLERQLGSNQQIPLELPLDPDEAPPQWSTNTPLAQVAPRPGYSNDATIHLEWPAADDTMGGKHANRAIDHYRVFRVFDGESSVTTTRDTAAVFRGLAQGVHALRVEAVDLVGNVNSSNTVEVLVDTSPPVLGFAGGGDAASHSGPVNVKVIATDDGDPASGLASLRWRIGDGPTTILAGDGGTELVEAIALTATGNHSLRIIVEDRAGNRIEEVHQVIIDTAAPSFLARVEPRTPADGWHSTVPVLHVALLDPGPSGNGTIQFRSGGDWQTYAGPTPLESPGEHAVQVRVTDGAGNGALTQLRVAYDPDAPDLETQIDGPQGEGDWFVGPVRINASASDAASGLVRLEYRVAQGAWRPLDDAIVLETSSEHQITLRALDAAGNQALRALGVPLDRDAPVAPQPTWIALPDGRIRGDWSNTPAADATSGVAWLAVDRADATGQRLQTTNLDADATEHTIGGLPPGEHRLRIRVGDFAGNVAATPWSDVTVENGTAQSGVASKVRGDVTLRPGTDAELVEVRYYVDGLLLGSTATQPFTITWHTSELADGRHDVRVVAVDASGGYHEELRTYNVRNSYTATLADHALPASAASVLAAAALVAATIGFTQWRRWAP